MFRGCNNQEGHLWYGQLSWWWADEEDNYTPDHWKTLSPQLSAINSNDNTAAFNMFSISSSYLLPILPPLTHQCHYLYIKFDLNLTRLWLKIGNGGGTDLRLRWLFYSVFGEEWNVKLCVFQSAHKDFWDIFCVKS